MVRVAEVLLVGQVVEPALDDHDVLRPILEWQLSAVGDVAAGRAVVALQQRGREVHPLDLAEAQAVERIVIGMVVGRHGARHRRTGRGPCGR